MEISSIQLIELIKELHEKSKTSDHYYKRFTEMLPTYFILLKDDVDRLEKLVEELSFENAQLKAKIKVEERFVVVDENVG